MSRAHMLYDNKKLSALPVKVVNWDDSFDYQKVFKKDTALGLILEASIVACSRYLLVDGKNKSFKYHFTAVHLDVSRAWIRRCDADGKEIEPDKSVEKKVNTGYLMSSYKNVKKEGVDEVPLKELGKRLEVDALEKLVCEKVSSLRGSHLVTIWADERELEGRDLVEGSRIRLRTQGDGPLLESFLQLDEETKNLASYSTSKPVGVSWTDKVMGLKEPDREKNASHVKGEGVHEDEWGD